MAGTAGPPPGGALLVTFDLNRPACAELDHSWQESPAEETISVYLGDVCRISQANMGSATALIAGTVLCLLFCSSISIDVSNGFNNKLDWKLPSLLLVSPVMERENRLHYLLSGVPQGLSDVTDRELCTLRGILEHIHYMQQSLILLKFSGKYSCCRIPLS